MPTASRNVRVRGQSGRHVLILSSSQFDAELTQVGCSNLWQLCDAQRAFQLRCNHRGGEYHWPRGWHCMNRRKLSLLRRESCFLLLASALLTICGPALADKRVALVVGNTREHFRDRHRASSRELLRDSSRAPASRLPSGDTLLLLDWADGLRDNRIMSAWKFSRYHRRRVCRGHAAG